MIGKEIEYKYKADNIHILDFVNFCKEATKVEPIIIDGYDYFYETRSKKDAFCRHRVGSDLNQLTFKEKLVEDNNYVRIEHNINLDKSVRNDDISRLMESMGYNHTLTLQKSSFIFTTDKYTAVYYICRNEDRAVVGRFIELELSENIDWKSEKNALKELKEIEKKFMLLGISPKKRLKESLWEMFRPKTKRSK